MDRKNRLVQVCSYNSSYSQGGLNMDEIRKELKERNLSIEGSRAEIVKRLCSALEGFIDNVKAVDRYKSLENDLTDVITESKTQTLAICNTIESDRNDCVKLKNDLEDDLRLCKNSSHEFRMKLTSLSNIANEQLLKYSELLQDIKEKRKVQQDLLRAEREKLVSLRDSIKLDPWVMCGNTKESAHKCIKQLMQIYPTAHPISVMSESTKIQTDPPMARTMDFSCSTNMRWDPITETCTPTTAKIGSKSKPVVTIQASKDDLLSQIRNGINLKSVKALKDGTTNVKNARVSLLDEIKAGRKLKKSEPVTARKNEKEDLLRKQLASRRRALQGADDDSNTEDEWD